MYVCMYHTVCLYVRTYVCSALQFLNSVLFGTKKAAEETSRRAKSEIGTPRSVLHSQVLKPMIS